MYDVYEIRLIDLCLAPMCAVGKTLAFGGKMSEGFADIENQCFIARVDA